MKVLYRQRQQEGSARRISRGSRNPQRSFCSTALHLEPDRGDSGCGRAFEQPLTVLGWLAAVFCGLCANIAGLLLARGAAGSAISRSAVPSAPAVDGSSASVHGSVLLAVISAVAALPGIVADPVPDCLDSVSTGDLSLSATPDLQ